MIQIIRSRGIGGIIIGLIVILISKIFFEPVPDFPQVTYTPLFASLKLSLVAYPNLDIILGLSFIILQAGLLTVLLNRHNVIIERSFFPFILYTTLAGVYSEQFYLNPASFLNFFLILIIDRLLRLQDIGKNPGSLFLDIGILIGLSLLFSKEAIFYIPFLLVGIIIIYSYSSNGISMLLLSTFIVMFITACVYFLIGHFDRFKFFFSFTPLNLGLTFSHWQERFFLLLIILLIVSFFAFIHYQFQSPKTTNKTRRFASVFGLIWVVGILVIVFQELNLWYNMALTVIPITVFTTNYFQDEKGSGWLKNLLFIVLILSLISIQLNY
jgi:hypothetical protein